MPTLLVFLKYPAPGQVKTRLASSVGDQQAAALYHEWIGVVLAKMQPLRETIRVVGYFDGAPLADFAVWRPLADAWWPQPASDLGARLAIGFEKAHCDGSPVVAIGTDCLELDMALVKEAFVRLAKSDVVFGPAIDGGYYLVGTSQHLPSFFVGVPWSDSKTLSSHVALCERNGWTYSTLPPRRDIDTIDDWRSHCSKVLRLDTEQFTTTDCGGGHTHA
jgi:rSAM/selenodomain-associated transferase 1